MGYGDSNKKMDGMFAHPALKLRRAHTNTVILFAFQGEFFVQR